MLSRFGGIVRRFSRVGVIVIEMDAVSLLDGRLYRHIVLEIVPRRNRVFADKVMLRNFDIVRPNMSMALMLCNPIFNTYVYLLFALLQC